MIPEGMHVMAAGGCAVVSASWIKAKNLATGTPVPQNWWEAGPYVIFIGALIYAVIHLWRALSAAQKEREERDREMIERLTSSLDKLSRAIDREKER